MKKSILNFLLFISFIPAVTSAQETENVTDLPCGTQITQQQLDYLQQTAKERQNFSQHSSNKSIVYIPVQNHVVRRTNGTGGLTTAEMADIMTTLNFYYINAGIQFYECSNVHYINNTSFFDFVDADENALAGPNDVSNVVNIYYFNSVSSSSGSLCGYSRFPPSVDRVIMDNGCALNGSTIVHELGHYFSLYHTHGKSNGGTTDELVNGSNCIFAGDNLCDTPADPNLNGLASTDCEYTGTIKDLNNQPYNPQVDNIMSYSRKECRKLMTTQQYNRIAFSALNDRNYLSCNAMAPTADFTANTTNSCQGTVYFTDRSTSLPSNWLWDFGDGKTSNGRNPVHQYTASSTYTVKLISSNANGSDSETKTNYLIIDLPAAPLVNLADSICRNDSANLSATSGASILWYDDEQSTTPVGSGTSYTTAPLVVTTTYYATNVVSNSIQNAGPATNAIGSGGNFSNKEYLVFNALKPFKLISVNVYANGAKNRTFELRNFLGLVMQSKTVFVSSGLQTVALNFDVPAEQNLQLGVSVTSDVDLYRNNSGVNYPYTVPDLLTISGSSQGSGFYYFFYNWKIKEDDCISAKVPVVVQVKDCEVGLEEGNGLGFKIFPNPGKGLFTLQQQGLDHLNVEIYNIVGTLVYKKFILSERTELDITDQPSGVYFIKIEYDNRVITKKLVIQ